MLFPSTIVSLPRAARSLPQCLRGRQAVVSAAAVVASLVAVTAPVQAQVVVYEPMRPVAAYAVPMAAGYPGGYVANYSPAGNYAAVTAFSPPVATGYVANYAAEVVSAPVAVTSYYAPAPVAVAPVAVAPVVAPPVYAAPVTTFYTPSAVAVPLYRRGLFGGLRPARTAALIPY